MTSETTSPDYVQTDFGAFAAVPEWLLFHPDAPDRSIRIFGILHRHSGPQGIYPGRERLAKLANCSTDSVDRATKALMLLRALDVQTRYRAEGGQRSNFYKLRFEDPDPVATRNRATAPSRKVATTPSRKTAAPPSRKTAAQNESSKERQKSSSKTRENPVQLTPKQVTDAWMTDQFAKIKRICPTAEGQDGYSLLNRMKKKFSPIAIIAQALDRLVDQGKILGVRSIWPVVTDECNRQQDAGVVRSKGAPVGVSKSNSRKGTQ